MIVGQDETHADGGGVGGSAIRQEGAKATGMPLNTLAALRIGEQLRLLSGSNSPPAGSVEAGRRRL